MRGGGGTLRRGGWRHLPAAVIAAAGAAPLFFMVAGSLREPGPPPRSPDLLPWPWQFGNYRSAFELVDLPAKLVNSIVVVAVTVPVAVLVASAAGFGLVGLPRAARRALVAVTIAAAMVPTTALLVGRFGIFRALGITDTLLPLMTPALLGASPFHVLFYHWAFRRISPDVFDYARLEGLSELAVYWRVGLPLTRPVTMAVAVASFALAWGAYLEPLVYLSDPELFTVPVAIATLANLDPSQQPLLLAAAVAATVPAIAVVLLTQRRLFEEVSP